MYEDAVGFITHAYLMPRAKDDHDVVVAQTRALQKRLGGRIQQASFDPGFHSPDNQRALAKIIPHLCLPMQGVHQAAQQEAQANPHVSPVAATASRHRVRHQGPAGRQRIGAVQGPLGTWIPPLFSIGCARSQSLHAGQDSVGGPQCPVPRGPIPAKEIHRLSSSYGLVPTPPHPVLANRHAGAFHLACLCLQYSVSGTLHRASRERYGARSANLRRAPWVHPGLPSLAH